jgi:hypothetical protein
VTRSRWLLTRLVVVGLITLAAAGLLSLTVTWWFRSIDVLSADQYANFDVRDVAPIGYAVFAFTLGAVAGAVIRRTVPAMATTLAGFIVARVAVVEWVRPHLIAPLHETVSLLDGGGLGFIGNSGGPTDLVANAPGGGNAWVQSAQIVTASGHATSAATRAAFLRHYCPAIGPPPAAPGDHTVVKAGDQAAFHSCQLHVAQAFHLVVTYQPASRYWTFQWLEAGVFLALALAAAVGCFWWVTRRAL